MLSYRRETALQGELVLAKRLVEDCNWKTIIICDACIDFILRVVWTSYLTSCDSSKLNYDVHTMSKIKHTRHFLSHIIFICPIAIAYSMGQIIKSVCVCVCISVSVRLRALSRSHFLTDLHQNCYRRKNPEK